MRQFGSVLAVVARLLIESPWRALNQDLVEAFNRYRADGLPRVSPTIIAMLVLAEDKRFFSHHGVDPIATGRAIWHRVIGKGRGGGSTIEQQLVRTLTRRHEPTLSRKLREILLASLVDSVISKAEIPGLYLSVAYFGWRMNGIQQASYRLGIAVDTATPYEAASIVARLKYPEPRVAPQDRARQIAIRTEYILRRAARFGSSTPSSIGRSEIARLLSFRGIGTVS